MGEHDDIKWLHELHAALWPPEPPRPRDRYGRSSPRIKLEVGRELTKAEWKRVVQAIAENKLVAEMIGTNMFGGVGVRFYEHPRLPGDDHEHVLTLTQEHLPGPTRYDHLADRAEATDYREPTGGNCSRAAWDIFSEFTHTEDNRRWLKQYGLDEPRDPAYYDY